MIDPVEFGKQMAAIVKEATAPLLKRIEELEKREPEPVDVDSVAKAAASLVPTPRDGKDADMDALKGHVAEMVKGLEPPPAPTVEEVAAVFERRFSDLTLSWERQARDTFEKAADRMPVPKDGRDALPLDSFDMELAEDGRTLKLKMQSGETVMEKSLRIATVLDRGPYRGEAQYEKGDAVTHGGSLWIAQEDGPEGAPGLGGKGWRLAVKKGRDGKDLRDNASLADTSKGVGIK